MVSKKKVGVFWFCNDLRLHDNRALMLANSLVDELVCVVVADNALASPLSYTQQSLGHAKQRFNAESLHGLNDDLSSFGHRLLYFDQQPIEQLFRLIETLNVSDVFRSTNAAYYENRLWRLLEKSFPLLSFHSTDTHTLFDLDELPFAVQDLPKSFTKFKNALIDYTPSSTLASITYLPPMPKTELPKTELPTIRDSDRQACLFEGGERHGLRHLKKYFESDAPAEYKNTRNNLSGWEQSTKFSPWLAKGSLSVREVYRILKTYEQEVIANESTYWIYFELLWREYFQWYAHKCGKQLFSFTGIKDQAPLNSYYPERFKKWVNGRTPYPLVNACMNELSETGFLSNRGRQLVASCLVNELAMDWRFGAAYFESVLIDYDVASNWGNWQYLAGVGADTRDRRHFNLEKQTLNYDPQGVYIDEWGGYKSIGTLDSVDAADWPVV